MATGIIPRVKLPKSARAGEVITIKTRITHPMDNGHHRNAQGTLIPRSIIHRMIVEFNGQSVIDVEMHPSVSTNPYFDFDAVVPESGVFQFAWYDDDGSVYTTAQAIDVT